MENIKLSKEDSEAVIEAFEKFSESVVTSGESFDKFSSAALKHKDLIQSEENEGWITEEINKAYGKYEEGTLKFHTNEDAEIIISNMKNKE